MNPFDVLNSINYTKENLFEDPQSFKEYSAFMVNRGLSYFPDTVLYANEMNRYSSIPNDWQFNFLLSSVPRRKRFSKWSKKENDSSKVSIVKEYYGYSSEKARQVCNIITESQLEEIKIKLTKGGR